MISTLIAASIWLTGWDPSWPDPYFGMSFRTYAEKHIMGFDSDDEPLVIHRRRKFFQLGLPVEVRKFSWGDARDLRLVAIPEFLFSSDIFIFNIGAGIEQDIPFRSYRSSPAGLFWGIIGGVHYGFIMNAKDLRTFTRALNVIDRTSLAALLKIYFGPRFDLNDQLSLKLRFGTDFMIGKIGQFQTRTSFSEILGSVLGFQLQLDFH